MSLVSITSSGSATTARAVTIMQNLCAAHTSSLFISSLHSHIVHSAGLEAVSSKGLEVVSSKGLEAVSSEGPEAVSSKGPELVSLRGWRRCHQGARGSVIQGA